MQSAWQSFAQVLSHASFSDPSVPVYANVNAEPVNKAADARRLLLEQLTAPVRWVQVIEALVRDFPGALFIEMGPGSVLAGLMKKTAPNAECMSCGHRREACSAGRPGGMMKIGLTGSCSLPAYARRRSCRYADRVWRPRRS
jgi:malonyl CoA-acyl carrier protein transacylase